MHITTPFLLFTTVLAIPAPLKLLLRDWTPSEGTTVSCDYTANKKISFNVGPQKESVLNDACAAMLPRCAYPQRLSNDTICIQTTDWALDGPKTSTQSANVIDGESTNKLSGWSVKFSITPALQQNDATSVFLTRDDCYGYFDQLVSKLEPLGCFVSSKGTGVGSIKVGGTSTLKDTIFKIEIVPRA
ncbi:hypothetical protein B0J11DRAFT_248329 [Dendryphion nanum]|uniref:Uncharacterized protein n=1 Tax=Dendryphion nanum TaxID=256645 RepID=A0A9P9ITD7_9PLEO|nr:hypothetical protein B0J11DRAFT_248329 [Dendryphion nanum]